MTETPAGAGERRALVGFFNQFDFAARVVLRHLREIDTIRVADPSAGAADDFQFSAGGVRYALQVKWADVDPVFQWSQFTKGTSKQPSVISKLASAWKSLRAGATTPLYIYLVASGRPSANRATSAGLSASTTSEVKSFAKFYYTSFQPLAHFLTLNPHAGWADVEQRPEVATWKPFWKTLQDEVDLEEEFVNFVRALRFEFGAQRPNVDGALITTDYRDEQRMARLFEELVVDPAHPVELTKSELLDRLDWLDRTKYRSSHHFSLPLAYGRNQKAVDDLVNALDSSDAGYVALVGPAGTGKSTVLSDFDPQHSRVFRYYAYVPESPDPRSVRGEAENFLHDVTVALNSHYPAGNLAPTDLRGLRERLQRQLDAAHQEFVESGVRTIVVVDGLDHIPREQNPSRSLLEELPGPAALGEGVFFLLGTQTCSVVPDQSIVDQLSPGRQIHIPALSADEVLEATRALGLVDWLTPAQIALIEPACEGHPLALTYLLADLVEVSSDPLREELASGILEDSSQFGGDLDKRYARYVQAVPADDQQVIRILAVAARFRTSLDLDWFATWADPSALDRFERTTTPFFFREDRRWRFIHNSFRRYLAEYTSARRGVIDAAVNRAWHLELAELCRRTDEKQWRYITDEEVAHRYFGGDIESLVATCTPSFLRSMLGQLRPISVVEDHLQLTIEAAADCNDSTALAALLLFRSELGLRRMAFDTDRALASTAVDVDPGSLGLDHALRGRELRTDPRTAATLAKSLLDRGMQDAANDVLSALGGLPALRDFIEHENRDWQDVAQDWCASLVAAHGIDIALADLDHSIPAATAIAPQDLFDQLEQELAQIPAEDWKSRRLVEQRRDVLQDAADAAGWTRDFMHLAAVKLAISERDDARATAVTERFDAEASPDFCVAARVLRLEGLVRDGALAAAEPLLAQIENILNDLEGLEDDDGAETVSPNLATRLRVALVVLRHWPARTSLIDALIPEGAVAPWPAVHGYVEDLSDFETAIRAITLGLVSPSRVNGIGIGEHRVSPALDRIERGLVQLCKLEIACDAGEPVSSTAQFRSILGMPDHHPKASPGESVDWTNLKRMAPEVLARLLNKYGEAGDSTSRDLLLYELDRIWTDPDVEPNWSSSSRIRVIKSAAPFAPAWAADHLRVVELTLAGEVSEPYEKVSNWLATASAWGSVPDIEAAQSAMRNAVVASLGVGTHESDDQLEVWPDWLSVANPEDADFRSDVWNFASRLVGASSSEPALASQSAARLLQSAWTRDPTLATQLARFLTSAGVLRDADQLEAMGIAVVADGSVDAGLALNVVTEMFMPTRRHVSSRMVAVLHDRFGGSETHYEQIDESIELNLVASDQEEWRAKLAESRVPDHPSQTQGPLLVGQIIRRIKAQSSGPEFDWESLVTQQASDGSRGDFITLLRVAKEHDAPVDVIANFASLAAAAGAIDEASAAVVEASRATDMNGWRRYWDGGSRQRFWKISTQLGDPHLKQLAAQDLARSFKSGYVRDLMSPSEFESILNILGTGTTRREVWPAVEEFLNHYAPAQPAEVGLNAPSAVQTSNEASLTWIVDFLGHPVRELDRSARNVLADALSADVAGAKSALTAAVSVGEAEVQESALCAVLVGAASRPDLEAELESAIASLGAANDAIVRHLAAVVAGRHTFSLIGSAPRVFNRPALELPPLLGDRLPPLGSDGAPIIDPADPRHHVVPFDEIILEIAEQLDLEGPALMHRTAAEARRLPDRWIADGVKGLQRQLESRDAKFTYRPWHYMAGRRATAALIAELIDGNELDIASVSRLGLIDLPMTRLRPIALPRSVPMPLTDNDKSGYELDDWITKITDAAVAVRAAVLAYPDYVLAEASQFRSLAWKTPSETRKLTATATNGAKLWAPSPPPWRRTHHGSDLYATSGSSSDPRSTPLVVRGFSRFSDSGTVNGSWLALNPAVARHLGWVPFEEDGHFSWKGSDGSWRARTVLSSRSMLSHRPPSAGDFGALVWQVVLSESAHTELSDSAGGLTRRIELTRQLPGRMFEDDGAPTATQSLVVD